VLGEAKFLRALTYFNLVRAWGEVPLRTAILEDFGEVHKPVSTREEIYAQIISDLQFAEQYCWNRAESRDGVYNDIGRATIAAAKGLLSKVYLHIASSARCASEGSEGCMPYAGFDANEYYQLAKTKAQEVVDLNISLEDDWADIWDVNNPNPAEVLFNVQATSIENQGSSYANLFAPRNSGLNGAGWGGGTFITPDYMKTDPFDTADYRFKIGILQEYTDLGTGFTYTYSVPEYCYKAGTRVVRRVYAGKYIDREAETTSTNRNDFPILRLAEVYLVLAEAKAEIDQDPESGFAEINVLRSRVGAEPVNSDALGSFAGDSPMEKFRELILAERIVELSMEGHRFFDLCRLGKLEEKCLLVGRTNRDAVDYYWPISQDEIDANNAINSNSPGY
jgi:hypothetical protein